MNRKAAVLVTALAAAPLGWAAEKAERPEGQPKAAAPAANPDLAARVQRLERLLDSQTLVQMVERMDALQREIQHLRGQVEELRHTVEGVRERQRDLYLDVDRRLSRLERDQAAAAKEPAAAPDEAAAGDGDGAVAAGDGEGNADGGEPAAQEGERKAYQQAFDLLRELRYGRAVEAFQGFLEEYPEGRYAPMAQYWLGEAHYAQGKYEEAMVHYWRLINRHPESPKLAEAMLKIGYSRNELGKGADARKILEELVRRYPDSTEAGQAQALLKKLGDKG